MQTLKTLDSSALSFIVLIVIYINVYNRSEKVFWNYKLFMTLIRVNMGLIIIDILSWAFNGRSGGWNLILNNGSNLLLYVMEPLASILWVLYVNFQVFHDEYRIGKWKVPLTVLFFINAIVAIISLFTGWFFSVDQNNVYHRGRYYWIHIVFCFSFVIYTILLIIHNRKRVEKRHYYALLLFAVPQILGSILQIFFYGVSFSWTGMMLSLLIVYFYIQDRSLKTDYLTGVYNRRELDNYIKEKIRNSAKEKSFSVILIDLDDFKQINDMYGHDVGDEALRNAVIVIRSCLRRDDFVARYGGDEFYIILDVGNMETLESTVARINKAVEEFNNKNDKPYELSFCMGFDVYNYDAKISSDDFLKYIDLIMYKNKENRKKCK